MTNEVILIKIKYLCIYNISIHTNFYHRVINKGIFLNSRKDRRKDGIFVGSRRTYIMSRYCRISFAQTTECIPKLLSRLNHWVLVLDVSAIIFMNWCTDVKTEFFFVRLKINILKNKLTTHKTMTLKGLCLIRVMSLKNN